MPQNPVEHTDAPQAGETDAVEPRRFATVIAVVNERAGSVGAKAADKLGEILRTRCANTSVIAPEAEGMQDAMRDAIVAQPDVLVVLGGDGTARQAAELAGPTGPPLILLPGGTMNVLPKALYGALNWPEALVAALDHGTVRNLPGARAGEHLFFVAGIFGSPARIARAREAARDGKILAALARFHHALDRAFSHRLRVRRDLAKEGFAEAVAVLCPLLSKVEGADRLETALLDPAGALSAFRLGIGALTGSWRTDPATDIRACRATDIRGLQESVPAVLDGEPVRFPDRVRIVAVPVAARVIALDETIVSGTGPAS